MSKAVLSVCIAVTVATGPAAAQFAPPDPEPPVIIPAPPEPLQAPDEPDFEDRAASLDALFAALATAGEHEWEPLQQQIMAVLARSDSPTMTFLLSRGTKAMRERDYDTALLFLDDLVRLAPDFAEGWNRRATVHFLMENYAQSVADIQRTLVLEPRHFGAMAGLGIILDRLEQDAEAYRVFQRALEIHPNLEGAKEAVSRLEPDVRGRDL
ncbi:MAG: tetratricopeptide repeat protein [Pikeienuella sp.]